MRELVHEPTNTRSSLISWIGVPASRPMYSSARRSPSSCGSGTAALTPVTIAGLVPQLTWGEISAASIVTSVSKLGSVLGGEAAPVLDRGLHVVGRRPPALHPLEGGVVGRDHPGAAAALDGHVAHGHAALHGEALDGRARVLDHVAHAAVHADAADGGEDQVLGRDARARAPRCRRCASSAACAAGASAWPARAPPRWCRCRRPAPRRRRGWRCASRRRRSSCPAASRPARGRSRARCPGPSEPIEWIGMPNSAQFSSSVPICLRESGSLTMGSALAPSVGTLWSAVASVRSGRLTVRPARRSDSKACGLVTSCTRCRSM